MAHRTSSSSGRAIALCLAALVIGAVTGCARAPQPRPRPKAKGTLAFFRPAAAQFVFEPCPEPCRTVSYGLPFTQPVVGDWNGAGYDSIGVYSNGWFALTIDPEAAQGQIWVLYKDADPGAIAVAGDWNGDGRSTTGIYLPSRGVFLLRNENDGSTPIEIAFGKPGAAWIPVTGDWNGRGRTQLGLYDPETATFHLLVDGREVVRTLGAPYSKPFACDWNGSGIDDVAVLDRGRSVVQIRNGEGAPVEVPVGNHPLEIPLFGRWPTLTD